jgi:hypothetical protein
MVEYGFEIRSRNADLGGGWALRLFEDGEEMGGGVFPLAAYQGATAKEARKMALADALAEAESWIDSRRCGGGELRADAP